MSSSMGDSELSFPLGREAEIILQIKEKGDETLEDSLCLSQFFLFCSFYSGAPLLSSRKAKSIDPSLIIKNTH